MTSVEYCFDDIGRKERKRQDTTDIARIRAVPYSKLVKDNSGLSFDLVKPAVRPNDKVDQLLIGFRWGRWVFDDEACFHPAPPEGDWDLDRDVFIGTRISESDQIPQDWSMQDYGDAVLRDCGVLQNLEQDLPLRCWRRGAHLSGQGRRACK